MKKTKIDIKFWVKMIAYLLIGIGIGLYIYPYFTDWMPFVSGIALLIGIIFMLISKK
ncbi:MAG: hypothetical protein QXZ43_03400 [Candidatus Aenigmatarchaeota archaeon]